ncbi:hypothetical protein RHMOL_Rhmol08G0000800 [Rhododendron molle]|uniref:Uncharacterized protein n=1 Tax=Rhododendron molle TaxID=49168 RepID=A0ACC0MI07_RHOML|nr:hypothetical protein RHMOL_Rhmol08G0000800 [Rhododendron molle]
MEKKSTHLRSPPSLSLPLQETRSLSAQVESNEMRPPTLGSSQAETELEETEPETESRIPVIGQVEYNSEGDEVVDTSEATIPGNPFPTINDDDKDVEECVSGVSSVTYVGDD